MTDDKGNIYIKSLSEDGQRELDYDALLKEDMEAKQNKYGKFEPSFFDKLATIPQEQNIKTQIWLKIAPYTPFQYPEFDLKTTKEQTQDLNKKAETDRLSHTQPVIDSVISKIKALGYNMEMNSTAGELFGELPPKVLRTIQNWDEIEAIEDGSLTLKPQLVNARPSAGILDVNNRGYTAAGVSVADIEATCDRVATNNPYLSQYLNMPNSNIRQDYANICPVNTYDYGDHTTEVAGVLKSSSHTASSTTNTNPNIGVATGINLWVSGYYNGGIDQIAQKAQAAVNQQNASIINLSLVCGGTPFNNAACSPLTWASLYDKPYDAISYYNHRNVIVSSGDDGAKLPIIGDFIGPDGTGKIFFPALGYNVITVGSYDDKGNTNWNDDRVSDFSSWVNPTSSHSDREKPDVAAPGSNIHTLGATSTFKTVSGTSFAAPIVSGGAALLLQRNSRLYAWPEAVKALILVTARNPVGEVNSIPSAGVVKYPPLSRQKWAQNKSELSNSKNVLNHDR